jgi:hypothetical protein
MFLELSMRSEYLGTDLDYINFNCWRWGGDNESDTGLTDNFDNQYRELESQYHAVYDATYNRLHDTIPYRNHNMSQEQAHVKSWLNIIMETYSSDNTIALSEKIFRALCLPTPWQVYSGRNTVSYLHSLGFDTMQDIVTHKYDMMIENRTAAYGDKMVDFLFEATENVQTLQAQDFDTVASRAQQAAQHNQELLAWMRYNWPRDFARWWPTVLEVL